jgi:hypothetical protein
LLCAGDDVGAGPVDVALGPGELVVLPVVLPVAELPPDAEVAEQVGVADTGVAVAVAVAVGVALAHAVVEPLGELVAVAAGCELLVEYTVPSVE